MKILALIIVFTLGINVGLNHSQGNTYWEDLNTSEQLKNPGEDMIIDKNISIIKAIGMSICEGVR